MIFLGNMSANADGIESVQARFLAAFAPPVAQDAVLAENEHVGDKLFVALVLLGFSPVQVEDVFGGGDDGQILLDVHFKPLKHAEFFE